jgi:hypothetical protein
LPLLSAEILSSFTRQTHFHKIPFEVDRGARELLLFPLSAIKPRRLRRFLRAANLGYWMPASFRLLFCSLVCGNDDRKSIRQLVIEG